MRSDSLIDIVENRTVRGGGGRRSLFFLLCHYVSPVRIILGFFIAFPLALLQCLHGSLDLIPGVVDQVGGVGIDADRFYTIKHAE